MTPVAVSGVAAALQPGAHELIALVGGGGKTTLLAALARQLPGRVLATCTTKMEGDAVDAWTLRHPTDGELHRALTSRSPVLVLGDHVGSKVRGVPPADVDAWFDLADHVVVEADGSRGRPCTAPAPHEPPVPTRATTVIAVLGADAIGRVIADQCHRPLRVAAVAGCSPYQRLTPEGAANLLASETGLRKNVPSTARFVVAITKVDGRTAAATAELATMLRERGITAVLVATTRS